MSFAQAAGFRINYITALHGLRDRAAIAAGERLAGVRRGRRRRLGGDPGRQDPRRRGHRRGLTEDKRAFARAHGADHVIDTAPEGWRDRLKALTDGKGPDVIFDPVCGPLFEPALPLTRLGRPPPGRRLRRRPDSRPARQSQPDEGRRPGRGGPAPVHAICAPKAAGAPDRAAVLGRRGRLIPIVGRTFRLDDFAAGLGVRPLRPGVGQDRGRDRLRPLTMPSSSEGRAWAVRSENLNCPQRRAKEIRRSPT